MIPDAQGNRVRAEKISATLRRLRWVMEVVVVLVLCAFFKASMDFYRSTLSTLFE